MKRILILLSIAAAALTLCVAAGASTIADVQALGYQVGVTRTYNAGDCTVYYISGFGIGVYADSCSDDFQSTIDALANPAAQCNRAWQAQHPDQLAAFGDLVSKGYSVSGDQCADRYTVTNTVTGEVVYSGPGDGLPSLDAQSPSAVATAGAPAAPKGPSVTVPATCLPLCPENGSDPQAPVSATPTSPSAPTTAQAPAAPERSTATTVRTTVTSADVAAAKAQPATDSQNPLLAAALSSAFNRDVTITSTTRCSVGAKRVSCRYLFGQIEGASVRMTIYGARAQTITLL